MNQRVLGAAFMAVCAIHYTAAAQDVSAEAAAAQNDPLVCVSGNMPGSNRETGVVRLTTPASKLQKFNALGFSEIGCDLTGKAFPSAGLTICQMRMRNNLIAAADFQNTHKISTAQVCDRKGRP